MQELLDVVGPAGKPLGKTKLRHAVHREEYSRLYEFLSGYKSIKVQAK